MLRDRYKKWGINDKNCKNRPRHQAAAAARRLNTRMALCQPPRIVELEDDESQTSQDSAGSQPDVNSLHCATLRKSSPHTALVSSDPRIHEILNGLSNWCDAWVKYPFDEPKIGPGYMELFASVKELIRRESQSAWGRLSDACSIETMLVDSRRTHVLLGLLYFLIHPVKCIGVKEEWQEERVQRRARRYRILQVFRQRSTDMLGPQHPITLMCIWSEHGLLITTLAEIAVGICQIQFHRESVVHRRRFGERSSELPLEVTALGRVPLDRVLYKAKHEGGYCLEVD
jgi:hypothetical protein